MKVTVYFPRMGFATGRMPHLKPMDRYTIPQALYYLHSICANLGFDTQTIDGNFTSDPVRQILDHMPDKVLVTSTTPQMSDALATIHALRVNGFVGEVYLGGSHVSANFGRRDFLLPREIDGTDLDVGYVPTLASSPGSIFAWVREVFSRDPLEAFSPAMNASQAKDFLRRQNQTPVSVDDTLPVRESTSFPGEDAQLQHEMFRHFVPNASWSEHTYKDRPATVSVSGGLVTSLGCSKKCSFCCSPLMYGIAFKHREATSRAIESLKAVRCANDTQSSGLPQKLFGLLNSQRIKDSARSLARDLMRGRPPKLFTRLRMLKSPRVSLVDIYFLMNRSHALTMADVVATHGLKFGIQTCLDGLDETVLNELVSKGMTGVLVGIEHPDSHTLGKEVSLEREQWLMRTIREMQKAGKEIYDPLLSYIVGLPGVSVDRDIFLLHHIKDNVINRFGCSVESVQVNLYTPYVPEDGLTYQPFDDARPEPETNIHESYCLTDIPFSLWGMAPVVFHERNEFRKNFMLCDMIYAHIYVAWLSYYLEMRGQFVREVQSKYPRLAQLIPRFEDSKSMLLSHAQRSS